MNSTSKVIGLFYKNERLGFRRTCLISRFRPAVLCAQQKPRTTSSDTLFQLVFIMHTAQDVLNYDPTIARRLARVQLRKVLRRRRRRLGVPGPRLEGGRPLL